MAAFAAKLPAGRWITGGAWDHENWTPARLPTRQLIDEATAGHPVFVSRLDGHMALANSRALQLAGITRETPDPPGGTIVRDAGGEPTGVLKDAAMDARGPRHPPPIGGPDRRCGAGRHALRRGERSHQRAGYVGRSGNSARLSIPAGSRRVDRPHLRPSASGRVGAAGGPRHSGRLRQRETPHRRAEGFCGRFARVHDCPFLRALPGRPQHLRAGQQRNDSRQ